MNQVTCDVFFIFLGRLDHQSPWPFDSVSNPKQASFADGLLEALSGIVIWREHLDIDFSHRLDTGYVYVPSPNIFLWLQGI